MSTCAASEEGKRHCDLSQAPGAPHPHRGFCSALEQLTLPSAWGVKKSHWPPFEEKKRKNATVLKLTTHQIEVTVERS
jgi:hypothetical protein